MPDIASWLTDRGLGKYIETFIANEVDRTTLQHLTEDDLRELGLPVGARRKILAAIAAEAAVPIASAAPSLTARRGQPERRQLTVMFIDLVGSTELSRQLDPEEMRDIIGSYHNAVSKEIKAYEGHVAKLMGDGVLAYFGWPRAHEDDAERATRAGLATLVATAKLTTPDGKLLAARIGIATGLVVVGDLIGEGSAQEEAVVGETPNLAARLQASAQPNSVVISDITHRLVKGLFDAIDLGPSELKGFGAGERAWRIVGESGAVSRFEALHVGVTPLVGRIQELERLVQSWRQARTGKGQVILLSGEPGIGKSRLIAAFHEQLRAEQHIRLRYFCSPYHMNSALHPVIHQLERAAGLNREDSASTKLDKLETLLRQTLSDITQAGPLLAELLSIDAAVRYPPMNLTAQAKKARTLDSLLQLLRRLAAHEPVMMLIEDVHWIDPTTREWLDMVVDRLNNLPVLLVITFRPEFEPPWTKFPHVTSIQLKRLSAEQGSAIVERLAGGKPLPPEVENQILAKTEGVPLFVEELTKTVLESGLLVDAGDHYALSGPLSPFAIPSTLQDSLMARLDRLSPVKELAQIGACIGRVFHYRVLAAVTGFDDARLGSALQQLENSELLFRNGLPPEASYTFKHALVQDTAYQSLLKSRRRQVHSLIASTLESKFTDIAKTEPETLAHHYTAAGLDAKAVAYWVQAGQQALKRSANVEAIAHLNKGLELIASLPESEGRLWQEIQLQSSLGVTMMAAKGFGSPDVLQAFSKARILSEKLGDKKQLFVALCGEASYHMISGNLAASDALGRQCLEIADALSDENLLLEAHHRQWATKLFMGDYAAAEDHAEYGIATYGPSRHHHLTYIYTGHDPGVCCRNYSAEMLWIRGYADQAVARGLEAKALAEHLAHPFTKVLALANCSYVHLLRREADPAHRLLDEWVPLSKELVLPLSISMGQFQRGWALAEGGRPAEGVREMREGIAAIRATGAEMGMPFLLCILARTCGNAGQPGKGLEVLEQALKIAEAGAKSKLAELLRTKGDLLLQLNPRDDAAEAWLQQAMIMARNEYTKSLELRAAASLSLMYNRQGRNREARKLLTPVYAWFTEGLHTRDLLDAKELIDQL
jgi:class 3 adenylate cyclase/predicted ATPase